MTLPNKILWHFLLLSLIMLAGCDSALEDKPTPLRKKPVHFVELMQVNSQRLATTFNRTGTVTTRKMARLSSQENGKVTFFPWREGDTVKKGQLLVQLDDQLLQAELKKALAETRQTRIDLKRIRNLQKKNVASEDELSKALTALNIAQSEVHLLKTRISYTKIYAPFDAIVSERLIEPGDIITQNTQLMTLIDPKSLYIKCYLSELILPQIDINHPVDIRIDAIKNQRLSGKIKRIHPNINTETRQATLEIDFDQQPDSIHPGQFVRLKFHTPAKARLLIPFHVVQHDRNSEFVFLYDNGKAKKTPIQTGIKIKNNIEITEGIQNKNQIITQGFIGLYDGKVVQLPTIKKGNE